MSLFLIALLAQLVVPWMSYRFFSNGLLHSDGRLMVLMALGQMAFLSGRWIAEAFQALLLSKLSVEIEEGELVSFLRKLLSLPLAFLENTQAADLMQRIQEQSQTVTFLVESLAYGIFALSSGIVLLAVLAIFSRLLLAVSLVLCVCSVLVSVAVSSRQRLGKYRLVRMAGNRQENIMEFLEGIPDIKLHGAGEARIQNFMELQQRMNMTSLHVRSLDFIRTVSTSVSIQGSSMLLSVIASELILSHQLSLGGLMCVQILLGQVFVPVTNLATLLGRLPDAQLSLLRASQIYQEDSENHVKGSEVKRGPVILEALSFSYKGTTPRQVFNQLSCVFEENQVTAVVGGSGAGKSTLLKLLQRTYAPDHGTISVGDQPLENISLAQWRDQVGVVLQDGFLFSTTVAGNVAVGEIVPDIERVRWALTIACIEEWVATLPRGYNTVVGRSGVGVSKGQSQRILLARALYRRPQYLFLDEATSALDATTEAEIIRRLQQALTRTTVVVVAHRASSIIAADRVVVLQQGRAVEQGTHRELIRARGVYSQLLADQHVTETAHVG